MSTLPLQESARRRWTTRTLMVLSGDWRTSPAIWWRILQFWKWTETTIHGYHYCIENTPLNWCLGKIIKSCINSFLSRLQKSGKVPSLVIYYMWYILNHIIFSVLIKQSPTAVWHQHVDVMELYFHFCQDGAIDSFVTVETKQAFTFTFVVAKYTVP